MQLKLIVIDVGAPRWLRRLSLFLAVSIPIVATATALVQAASVWVPHRFQAGDALSADTFNENFSTLRIAVNSVDLANPDCPISYQRVGTSSPIVCRRGFDELIRVRVGTSSFWVDRFEASIWSNPDGSGTQYGANADDFPSTFPKNGQVAAAHQLYAVSRPNVMPTANVTWFQANMACRANGKQLLTGDKWLVSAKGTSDAATSTCVISATAAQITGLRSAGCQSNYGAQDMIGNLKEWTADWYASMNAGATEAASPSWPDTSGGEYRGDGLWNINTYGGAQVGNLGWTLGVPAAAVRGGSYEDGSLAGRYAFSLYSAPSDWSATLGFRCVTPR